MGQKGFFYDPEKRKEKIIRFAETSSLSNIVKRNVQTRELFSKEEVLREL